MHHTHTMEEAAKPATSADPSLNQGPEASIRLILLLMVKNESRILERSLQSALPHVDAVAVLDTGSTDDTQAIAERVLAATGKPYRVAVEPFVNFGKSRTRSFEVAVDLCTDLSWDPSRVFALAMDADMLLVPSPAFRSTITAMEAIDPKNGYSLIQANGHIKYHNMRLMKCAYPWKCIGATHEYWSGDPTGKIPYEVVYLDDRNDGGCKADKFERDVRLLSAEIAENPRNDRAHYYLGQSLKDLGRFDEAIEMFLKRIELGGWYEEVWYAHYMIGKCYGHKGDEHEMEKWMNRAFDRHPRRAEPLYHLCRHFREVSQHYKAYHYYLKGRGIPYPKDDALFIEDAVYHGLFDYENTILACYVNGKTKQDALVDLVTYINRGMTHYLQNVWDNLVFYLEPLANVVGAQVSRLGAAVPWDEYKASSCCIVPMAKPSNPARAFLVNVRYVNYSIDHMGAYHMRSADGHVKTRNGVLWFNRAYQVTEDMKPITEEYERHESHIEGLEDVRVFSHEGRLRFTASSKNATADGRIRIVCGDYDPYGARMSAIRALEPPRPSQVEKNWIYVPSHLVPTSVTPAQRERMNFIYGWSPFEIGAVNPDTNQLEIHTTYPTNEMFRHARGSSPICEYEGEPWAVVHFVKYSTPRIYYHSLVRFDRATMRPQQFSAPFVFCETRIEYCVGLDLREDTATFLFSRNDTDASMIRVPMGHFRMLPV